MSAYIYLLHIKQFFFLLHCYWGFGQPDKEKFDQFYDHLNFSLPGLARDILKTKI